MEIVILDGYTLNPGDLSWEGFEKIGHVTYYDRTKAEETVSRIGGAEVILTNKTAIGRQVMDQCPGLKYIGVLATGYNVVDVAYAAEKGITVTNIPTYGTATVAQYVFALLLEICHNVRRHADGVAAGKWTDCPDFCYWDYPQIELAGKTMGIVGYGKIGRQTGMLAQAFGMKILAYDLPGTVEETGQVQAADLETLYRNADVISLHCPLTAENKGMIDSHALGTMKKETILINTARGPLVNEQDLYEALENEKIYAYAGDVASKEPIEKDNPLLKAKNCILTPHVAWATKAARGRLMDIAVENLKAYINGKPENTVQ